ANREFTVSVMEPASGKIRATLKGGRSSPSALAFSGDGNQLASGDEGGTIRVWNLAKKEIVKDFRPKAKGRNEAVKGLACTAEGKGLISAVSDDGESALRVWDLASGAEQPFRAGHRGGPGCVAFSPCGRYIATVGWPDSTVRILDAETGEAIHLLQG